MQAVHTDEPAGPHGVFGPESLTWRLHADPLLGLACLRSLLLRSLHPAGLAAVFATSRDADDLWCRLARVLRYVGVMTYGSSVEAAMAGARARGLLIQISGFDRSGPFRGDDPELLLWMHCCQTSSFLEVLRRGGVELTASEQNRYLAEQLRMAAMWGLEPELVPTDAGSLTRYFRQVRPRLELSHGAWDFASTVVAAPLPHVMQLPDRYRPSWAPVAGLAFAALPAWARRMYGIRYPSGAAGLGQSATTVALHSLRDSLRERIDHPVA